MRVGYLKRKRGLIYLILACLFAIGLAVYLLLPKMMADEVYPLKYTDWIRQYSTKYNVDPALVAAVILQESRFNPKAGSSAGAQGLMQFMPGTAKTMAKETGHWPTYDIFDAETSIEFGAAHLRDLLIKYNGNVDQALAGYNAGTGTVDSWLRANVFQKIIGSNSKGETVNYVKKVKNYQTVYATMYAKELGIIKEPIALKQAPEEDQQAKVRGFVWTEIFSSIFKF
jgi:soluble lytic murein transglycosylase